jgi:hypothetical protein
VSVWVPALKTISSFSASSSSTSTGSPKRLPTGGMEPTSRAGKNSDSWASRTSSEPSTAPTFLKSTRRSAGSTTMTRSPASVFTITTLAVGDNGSNAEFAASVSASL